MENSDPIRKQLATLIMECHYCSMGTVAWHTGTIAYKVFTRVRLMMDFLLPLPAEHFLAP